MSLKYSSLSLCVEKRQSSRKTYTCTFIEISHQRQMKFSSDQKDRVKRIGQNRIGQNRIGQRSGQSGGHGGAVIDDLRKPVQSRVFRLSHLPGQPYAKQQYMRTLTLFGYSIFCIRSFNEQLFLTTHTCQKEEVNYKILTSHIFHYID